VHFYPHLCTPRKTFWSVINPKIALGQARLTPEFFAGGLPKKKVDLGGMSILLIILSLKSECHTSLDGTLSSVLGARPLGALPVHVDEGMPWWIIGHQWWWWPTCIIGRQHMRLPSIYTPYGCPFLLPPSHILSSPSTRNSLPKICTTLNLTLRRTQSYISSWIDLPRYTPPFSTFYLEMHRRLGAIFEWIPPTRVELIYFLECVFVIGDLDCMTLLSNVHILCIIASEFRLIGTNVLEPYETCRLQI
jgi:hypothetical protein